jgi:hypothetical protein
VWLPSLSNSASANAKPMRVFWEAVYTTADKLNSRNRAIRGSTHFRFNSTPRTDFSHYLQGTGFCPR